MRGRRTGRDGVSAGGYGFADGGAFVHCGPAAGGYRLADLRGIAGGHYAGDSHRDGVARRHAVADGYGCSRGLPTHTRTFPDSDPPYAQTDADPDYYCLDVPGFGGSIRLDAPLQAHTCKWDADDQLFYVFGPIIERDTTEGRLWRYRIGYGSRSNFATGRVLF